MSLTSECLGSDVQNNLYLIQNQFMVLCMRVEKKKETTMDVYLVKTFNLSRGELIPTNWAERCRETRGYKEKMTINKMSYSEL